MKTGTKIMKGLWNVKYTCQYDGLQYDWIQLWDKYIIYFLISLVYSCSLKHLTLWTKTCHIRIDCNQIFDICNVNEIKQLILSNIFLVIFLKGNVFLPKGRNSIEEDTLLTESNEADVWAISLAASPETQSSPHGWDIFW